MWGGEEIKGRRGGNVRNGRCRFERLKERRAQAKERQEAYDALTLEQKLVRLEERLKSGAVPGEAKKERARLQGAIDAAREKKLAKALNPATVEKIIQKENDALVKEMQTKKARKGMKKAFDAPLRKLGEVAVKTAQRISPPNDPGDSLRRQRAERWAQKKGRKDKK